MAIKVVVIDLDGTLLNSEKGISKRNIEALQTVKNSGVELVFATARPPRAVKIPNVDLESIGTMIFYNGAMMKGKDVKLSNHIGISSRVASEVMDFILEIDADAMMSVEIKDKWFSHRLLDYASGNFMKIDHNPEIVDMDILKSQEVTKILITDFNAASLLQTRYGDVLNIIETDNHQLIQIMDKNADKEKAVRKLVEIKGYSMDEVMCFGDDYNDLSLFMACGYSVAMENGIEELKAVATETTKSNDDDGVGIILEKLFI